MDKISPEKRSWNMSRIKRKDTKMEILVRRFLYSKGLRYRLKSSLPGKPDIVFPSRRIVVFVNGCFWHMHHNCPLYRPPKTNADFWRDKLEGNAIRDKKNYQLLENAGWKVLILWECELEKDPEKTLASLAEELISGGKI